MHKLSASALASEVDALVFDPATRGVLFINPVLDMLNSWPVFIQMSIIAIGFFIVGAKYGKHLGRMRAITQILPALAAFERLQSRHIKEHKELTLRRATMERMQGAGVDTASYEPIETIPALSPYQMDSEVVALLGKPEEKR